MKRAQLIMKPWHVATAAEGFAAAQFARLGWDVSVQYGANQPEYDLVAVKKDRMLKISVKGSQKGSWGIAQSYLQKAEYHRAIDNWFDEHSKKTVFCLVQFKAVADNELPRMYLATPAEIADRLRKSAGERGATILYENHPWSDRARGKGTTDRIPESWRFTEQRIDEILGKTGQPVSGDHV
jgi:Holliday junction resolvase-like predicted endonuclease